MALRVSASQLVGPPVRARRARRAIAGEHPLGAGERRAGGPRGWRGRRPCRAGVQGRRGAGRRRARRTRLRPRLMPASASQMACTWLRTRSSLARSRRGGWTLPDTIRVGRRKKYWSWALTGRAVADDQRRLAGPPGPAGALGVVGRGGRDVAHADHVEAGDVDAELHGRRAEQDRQRRRSGTVCSRSSRSSARTWAVCSRASRPARACGDCLVEVDEELVGSCALGSGPGDPDQVTGGLGAVAGLPAQSRGGDLVADVGAVAGVASPGPAG